MCFHLDQAFKYLQLDLDPTVDYKRDYHVFSEESKIFVGHLLYDKIVHIGYISIFTG